MCLQSNLVVNDKYIEEKPSAVSLLIVIAAKLPVVDYYKQLSSHWTDPSEVGNT